MPTLTLKNIPGSLYECLKQSGAANRRSLNSEILERLALPPLSAKALEWAKAAGRP